MTTPLLLLAVLLSAGAAYAALLKYAEKHLVIAGMFTGHRCFKCLAVEYLLNSWITASGLFLVNFDN